MKSFKNFILIGLFLGLTSSVSAVEIAGVTVAPEKTVGGKQLKLNGAGLRTVFVLKVKAYVASFYAPTALKSYEEVLSAEGPFRFEFTFLRAVGQTRVTDAWVAQFKDSVSHVYPGFEKDRDEFVKMFGPLKKGGIESVEIEGNETRVYDDGALKGKIEGKEFQKSFLSLWFGSKPVLASLKQDLLGQQKK